MRNATEQLQNTVTTLLMISLSHTESAITPETPEEFANLGDSAFQTVLHLIELYPESIPDGYAGSLIRNEILPMKPFRMYDVWRRSTAKKMYDRLLKEEG